jgi:hypothetical protein
MGWWHNIEVGGWALLALRSYNTLAVLPHCLPPPCSPSGCHQRAAYPVPKGAHGMVGVVVVVGVREEGVGVRPGVVSVIVADEGVGVGGCGHQR